MLCRIAAVTLLALTIACLALPAQTQAAAPGQPVADLATVHAARVKLPCAACHGDTTPTALTPEESRATTNQQCVACHGDAAKLAAALAPKLANRHINPHAAHLVEIDCTTCHGGHAASESFCLQCHAFDMPMPGRSQPKQP